MKRFIITVLVAVLVLGTATVALAARLTTSGEGTGIPNLGAQAMQAMTLQYDPGSGWAGHIQEPVGLSETDAGNAVVHFQFNSYVPPRGVRVLWDGNQLIQIDLPQVSDAIIFKNYVDVELRSNGTFNVVVRSEQVAVYLGNGRYGFKTGNEIAQETLGLQCPHNEYVKPCNGCPLECAP